MSTPTKIAQFVAPTQASLLYSPDDGRGTLITNMWIANTTGSAATVTFYDVPNGLSASDNNTLVPQQSIAANSYEQLKGSIVLGTGNELQVKSNTANALTITVYGVEYVTRAGKIATNTTTGQGQTIQMVQAAPSTATSFGVLSQPSGDGGYGV